MTRIVQERKMSDIVKVSFEIEKERADTIVGLLIREVSNFQISEVVDVPRLDGHHKSSRWANAPALDILKMMSDGGVYHYKTIGEMVMPKFGFKPTTVSVVLGYLLKSGKIRKVKRGHYTIAKK